MALLPTQAVNDPTLDAINAAVQNVNNLQKPRPYLGMSAIGMECEAFLWRNFRWCGPSGGGFDAKSLMNFEDGHRTEDLMADRLRMVPGVELYTLDPSTGQQFGFSDLGGHFRGHIDGAIRGILQAPKAWHMWENKASEKGPHELAKAKEKHGEKAALAAWNPTYHAQAILYMHYGAMDRHYLTCTSPGGRLPITSVRTDADDAEAERLKAKAERVIFAGEPLARIGGDATFWKCKTCVMASQCHGTALPSVSCRTCAHATPERDGDGRWSCARWKSDIPIDAQRTGCDEHRYIPALLSRWGSATDASETENWIEYTTPERVVFRNGVRGPGSFASSELAAMSLAMLGDRLANEIRNEFDGRFVPAENAA
ncbi:hypothetical protein [Xylophilus sp.]|uniref:hypothetical protein n=1 Tax=Xylophilus sp. TaxID=2653893 RepID=UPI0013B8B741|nr:hypothetical protein [Xylophilus sp.]KAF1045648.1 MAG: hypothetical protein GAK38_02940 [Xylophilus sp.]